MASDDYIETISALPTELQRNFNLMRELDSQSQLLIASIEERVNAVTNPPPGGVDDPVRSALTTAAGLERLRQDCRRALEQADEKVSLAAHAHELVERYLRRLDDDLARYETTLQTKLDVDAMKASRRRRRAEDQELRRARKAKVEEEPARTLGQSMFASVAGEETYCICKRVSFGQMIACDDPHCKIEWYHIGCVGLKTIPSGKWYCPQCLARRKR